MLPDLQYHWQRMRSRLHRLRLALHAGGPHGLLARIRDKTSASNGTAGPPAAQSSPGLTADTRGGTRILLIDGSTPRPDRDSGSLRAFNLMWLLGDLGYQVEFMPDDREAPGAYGAGLRALGVVVHAKAAPYPRWFAHHLRDYDALVISRYHLAEFLLPLARRHAPDLHVVLDTVDLHHLREHREAVLRGDSTLLRLSATTRKRELAAISAADQTWVVSTVEADLVHTSLPTARVAIVPNLHDIEPDPRPFALRSGLLFVGGARHPPNVDALRWLLAEIFPRVRERLPDCMLHVAGADLDKVTDIAAATPGVRIYGHVPDLAPLLSACRVGLAPLRFGAGVKGKVNLCMAAGMPVVATTCGAEGMHALDGENLLLADDATAFADAVVRAHEDEALWSRLSEGGQSNVRSHFSFEAARATIAASLPAVRA